MFSYTKALFRIWPNQTAIYLVKTKDNSFCPKKVRRSNDINDLKMCQFGQKYLLFSQSSRFTLLDFGNFDFSSKEPVEELPVKEIRETYIHRVTSKISTHFIYKAT